MTIISWRQFEKVLMGRLDDGKDQHALCLENKQTPPHVMTAFFKPKLKEFVVHNFEAKW